MQKSISHGQEGWFLENSTVRLFLTETGGHMAPVSFFPETKRPVEPYYISPWQDEDEVPDEPVLKPLRGNFFCAPFGADNAYRGEQHVAHGEPATAKWDSPTVTIEGDKARLVTSMNTTVRQGRVTKEILLRRAEAAVYQRHTLEGFSGPMPLGHHATLAPPRTGVLEIGHSPVQFGIVSPRSSLAVQEAEYFALSPMSRFTKIDKVPTIWKAEPYADCSVFPSRPGFADILQIFQRQPKQPGTPAWITATAAEQGYLWFSLKDPAILNSTVFWMENRGRHQSPWRGRNCCIGLEDVCAYFAEGLKSAARKNPVSDAGIPTAVRLNPKKPMIVAYIEGVIPIPRNFGRCVKARFPMNTVIFSDAHGREASASIAWDFLFGSEI